MPVSVFSSNSLNAAAPGLGRLAAAIGAGGGYQKGYEGELGLQSKLAQAMAQIEAHNATAAASRAKADQDTQETATMRGRAGVGDELLAGAAGTDVPTVRAWRDQVTTGRPAMTSASGDPGTDEAIGIASSPVVSTAIAKLLAERAPEYAPYRTNTKDMKPDDLAQARQLDRQGRLSDAVIAGTADRNAVGGAQAAAGGKDLFHTDTTGAVLDKFTGGLNTDNQMAGSTINLRGEQAGNQKAGAAAHYAQADSSRALADQRRQVTANGPGPGKVPVGFRYTTGADGEARLEPIPGGPKDPNSQVGKPLPGTAAKGFLENHTALRNVTNALSLIQGVNVGNAMGDTEATGLKGLLPDSLLSRVDPEGVSVRAAIADIGSLKIHDRSGAAVTASETPRLKPFIPSVTDSPETIVKKLTLFEQNYRAIMDESEQFYRDSGYNVPSIKPAGAAPTKRATSAPAKVASDADYNALPSGAEFIAPDGSHRRKP